MKIGIVVASTRPGRVGHAVGKWVQEHADRRDGAQYELIDLADYDLPLLSEPTVPGAANGKYENEKTRAWAETIRRYDGFVFVTPEYNHSVPAAMKNAVDVLYVEWVNKTVGFVAYGADGGVRSVEHWRAIVANLFMHAPRGQVSLSLIHDFGKDGFAPGEHQPKILGSLLDQLEELTAATETLRG